MTNQDHLTQEKPYITLTNVDLEKSIHHQINICTVWWIQVTVAVPTPPEHVVDWWPIKHRATFRSHVIHGCQPTRSNSVNRTLYSRKLAAVRYIWLLPLFFLWRKSCSVPLIYVQIIMKETLFVVRKEGSQNSRYLVTCYSVLSNSPFPLSGHRMTSIYPIE